MKTVLDMATQLKNKEVSSLELVESYIARVHKTEQRLMRFTHG